MYRWGVGDVLNPTAGTALDCGLFNFGVFRPECWCLSFPSLCSKANYTAAVEIAHPENIAVILPPPAVGAPVGNTPPVTAIDTVLADQMTAWKAQNSGSMNETQGNVERIGAEYESLTAGGVPWYWWLAGGLGIFGLIAMGGGSARRYGR